MKAKPLAKLNSLINILSQLDKGSRITATFLANSLGVTERTIYRYMITLQNSGYPIFFDRKRMSYCFVDGYRLNQDANQSEMFQVLDLKSHMLGATPIGLASFDETAQCVMANHAAAVIIGATNEEILKQNYLKLESWEKSGLLVMAQQVMQTGIESAGEFHLITSFGKEVWLNCNMSRFTKNGKNYLLLVIQDFTDRKLMELALKESEEILSLFVEHNPAYTFIKDEELRFAQVSRNYEKLLGKTREQIIGKKMTELFPKDFADKLIKEDQAVLASGKVITIEEELGGRYFSTTKFPFERGGNKYLAGYAIEITDRINQLKQPA